MENTIDITLMRHGRSQADDEQVHEGRYDSPLTETGRQQALRRARELQKSGIKYDCIISSSLSRAQETASIISDILHSPIEIDADWMEVDNGPLAGLPFDEASAKYPTPNFTNPYQPYVSSVGEGESEWDLQCRAVKALAKVIQRGSGSYLIVAHGGILNATLRSIFNASPPINKHGVYFRFGDTGYIDTSYFPGSHKWIINQFKPV